MTFLCVLIPRVTTDLSLREYQRFRTHLRKVRVRFELSTRQFWSLPRYAVFPSSREQIFLDFRGI
ncbi:hypothetical protein CW304_13610 [Bacillus sp. UFRGS-B20]|nr:hypothetical protein CW304_13610 [Bacillus sp. UFRGS-B20]